MNKNIIISLLFLYFNWTPGLASQPKPFSQCISVGFRHQGDFKLKLASARIMWIDKTSINFNSDYVIDLIGVSGKIYSAPCSTGGSFVDGPVKSSGIVTAIIPCEENCIGYRFHKKDAKEVLSEERFTYDNKFDVAVEFTKNENLNIRTKGHLSSIVLYYSEDKGFSWREIDFIPNSSGFQIANDGSMFMKKKKSGQSLLLEIQASMGLHFIRKRFSITPGSELEPIIASQEVQFLHIPKDLKRNWAE